MTAVRLARLDIEAAQERLPGAVYLPGGGAGTGGPQPQRLRSAVAGQVLDVQPDESALDDGQLAGVAFPAGAGGQLLVQPCPGRGPGGAVPGGRGAGGRGRGGPGS